MARQRSAAPAKKGIAVDFTGVESGGGAAIPEDDYLFEVEEVTQEVSSSDNPYLKFVFKVDEGTYKGRKVYHNCSLQPQALFNLRGVLEALGFEVPEGVMELDPADLIGEKCGGAVAHEKYEGKDRARIVEFFPASELDGEEAAPETPPPAATKVVKKAPAATPAPTPAPTAAPAAAKKKVKKAGGIQVGSTVTFTDDEGTELSGEVKAIEDGNATVVVGDDEWELELSELTAAA